uniref:Uncharacterized protein n=1 Tax=Molossus molossus TaxID=27622 RepID=A0A7J8DQ46_MOLMO|nr:hypothetical protein HJG59_009284 [Molossus molossus]
MSSGRPQCSGLAGSRHVQPSPKADEQPWASFVSPAEASTAGPGASRPLGLVGSDGPHNMKALFLSHTAHLCGLRGAGTEWGLRGRALGICVSPVRREGLEQQRDISKCPWSWERVRGEARAPGFIVAATAVGAPTACILLSAQRGLRTDPRHGCRAPATERPSLWRIV